MEANSVPLRSVSGHCPREGRFLSPYGRLVCIGLKRREGDVLTGAQVTWGSSKQSPLARSHKGKHSYHKSLQKQNATQQSHCYGTTQINTKYTRKEKNIIMHFTLLLYVYKCAIGVRSSVLPSHHEKDKILSPSARSSSKSGTPAVCSLLQRDEK